MRYQLIPICLLFYLVELNFTKKLQNKRMYNLISLYIVYLDGKGEKYETIVQFVTVCKTIYVHGYYRTFIDDT